MRRGERRSELPVPFRFDFSSYPDLLLRPHGGPAGASLCHDPAALAAYPWREEVRPSRARRPDRLRGLRWRGLLLGLLAGAGSALILGLLLGLVLR